MIDRWLNREFVIGGIRYRVVDAAFSLCLFVLAFLIRWRLMPIESADYFGFLEDWMRSIRQNGGFRSLSMSISNYTPPYICLLYTSDAADD